MAEEISFKEAVIDLTKKIDELAEQKKAKKFNIPFFSRLSNRQLKKKYATICYISGNKEVKFARTPVDEGVIVIDGTPHAVNAESILTHKGKPFIIQPEWNLTPFSVKQEDAVEKSRGWKTIINYLKGHELTVKKGLGAGAWIFWAAIIGGVAYYAFTSGLI